ncbi:MAG: S9 family peptidase [Candidatus Dormibacteraeota bacterium]|nr:S9 family peptidase [Candidatus Dormibacteraeota bacterium]
MDRQRLSTRQRIAAYGTWRSPITADLIVNGFVALSQIQLDGDDIYWVEGRPTEKGRNVVVRRSPAGEIKDVTPAGFNVRTRVHEYGGGSYLVAGGTVWFSNYDDQRLYRQERGGTPAPITPAGDLRYADAVHDRARRRLICVREDHTSGAAQAVNSLVGIDVNGRGDPTVLVEGNDFYSSPRLSPSGSHLAWLTWNHPNMPWDGTELWVAEVTEDGRLRAAIKVAGGRDESLFQPEWSAEGVLYFMSDRTGWWNLYRWRRQGEEAVLQIDAELATPQWLFGLTTYAFDSEARVVCQVRSGGLARLATIDTQQGRLDPVETPYTAFGASIRALSGKAVTIAGSPTEPFQVVVADLVSGRVEVLRRSMDVPIDPTYLSVPDTIEFPTEGGLTAHAFYYPPRNPDYIAPEGELPPLIVMVHGGPTGAVTNALDLGDQYWTSRGFGYLVVNYGGSSGYGREYRQRLNRQWGVVDVADCISGARYLVDRDRVDGARIAITGGSAGGYTVLRALTTTDFFKAGASHFGISDLEIFHDDTHKFESMYDQSLIGPWSEAREVYRERSPIHAVDRIKVPVILFQGLEDKVVPPNQAELIVAALKRKGLPVAYVAFEGEQHGFRIAKNIKRSIDGELYFYSRVFAFDLPDQVEPVEIDHLPAGGTSGPDRGQR